MLAYDDQIISPEKLFSAQHVGLPVQHEERQLREAHRAHRGQSDAPTSEMYAECQELLQVSHCCVHVGLGTGRNFWGLRFLSEGCWRGVCKAAV